MSFTDEELKRLKEHLAGDTVQLTWYSPVTRDNLQALLARLEAAEKMEIALEHCRNRPHEHNPMPDFTMTQCEVIDRALAEWRNAAGK